MSCIEQIPQNWITRIYSEVCYGYISQGEVSVLLDESEGGGSDRLVTLDSGAYIEEGLLFIVHALCTTPQIPYHHTP